MKHPYLISPRDLFPRNSWTMSWRNCKKRIKRRSLRCQAKIGASTPPRLIVTRFFTHESCNKKQRIWRFRYHLRKIPTTYSAKLKKLCDFVVEVKKGLPKNLQIFFLQELGDWWCVQDKSLGFGWEKKTCQDLGLGALGRPMVLDFLILALNTSVFFENLSICTVFLQLLIPKIVYQNFIYLQVIGKIKTSDSSPKRNEPRLKWP